MADVGKCNGQPWSWWLGDISSATYWNSHMKGASGAVPEREKLILCSYHLLQEKYYVQVGSDIMFLAVKYCSYWTSALLLDNAPAGHTLYKQKNQTGNVVPKLGSSLVTC